MNAAFLGRWRHMMKALVTLVRLLLLVVMVVMMLTGQAQASETCHAINAKGVGQDLGGGMTTAQIIGGGLLHGTTVGSFAITGMSGNVASIEGTVTFTTEDGTLTVNLKGTPLMWQKARSVPPDRSMPALRQGGWLARLARSA